MTDPHEFDLTFERILADCLEALVVGSVSVQGCLERYPQYAERLKPLLQTAYLTMRLDAPPMSESGVYALEQRLLRVYNQKLGHRRGRMRPMMGLRRMAAMIAVVFALCLTATGGTVAASANTLPGDTLYAVKRAWESVVLALAAWLGQVDHLWLHLAQVRLEEFLALYTRNQADSHMLEEFAWTLQNAIANADANTAPYVAIFLIEARGDLDATIQAQSPLQTQYAQLRPMLEMILSPQGELEPLPPSATPTLTPTMILSATPTDEIAAVETKAITPTASATPTSAPSITPRIPPTATRTNTPNPTASATPTPPILITPLPTASATWTALPLPSLSVTPRIPQPIPPSPINDIGVGVTMTPTPSATYAVGVDYWVRDTQRAVYATQTRIAQDAAATEDP